MTCPHCHALLSETEVKLLWSAYTSAKRRNRTGGPKVRCSCGKCPLCKRREVRRKYRANAKGDGK